MPRLRQQLVGLIDKHGLSEHRVRLLETAKPSIRLISATTPVDGGKSCSGGESALLAIPEWPEPEGRSLQILAQIDLGELPPIDPELPVTGLLSFFYDAEEMPRGRGSKRNGWAVVYTPDPTTAHHVPSLASTDFTATPFNAVPDITVPTMRSIDMTELNLSAADRDRYWEFRQEVLRLASPEQSVHRMLGHPDGIQGCMQRTLQFTTRGLTLPRGAYDWYEHPHAAELMPGAHEWRLLLQIDSDLTRFGQYWGNAGRIYHWIHRDALVARRFEESWMVLQM